MIAHHTHASPLATITPLVLAVCHDCSGDAELQDRMAKAEARVLAAEAERDATVAGAQRLRAAPGVGAPVPDTVRDLDAALANVAAARKPLEDAAVDIDAKGSASRRLVIEPDVGADVEAYEPALPASGRS